VFRELNKEENDNTELAFVQFCIWSEIFPSIWWLDYELDSQDIAFRFPSGSGPLYDLQSVHTGSRAHLAF